MGGGVNDDILLLLLLCCADKFVLELADITRCFSRVDAFVFYVESWLLLLLLLLLSNFSYFTPYVSNN